MTNLSLARIMYGTNENVHTISSMYGANRSSLYLQSRGGDSAEKGTTPASATFGGLLRKAWAALHHKG